MIIIWFITHKLCHYVTKVRQSGTKPNTNMQGRPSKVGRSFINNNNKFLKDST